LELGRTPGTILREAASALVVDLIDPHWTRDVRFHA